MSNGRNSNKLIYEEDNTNEILKYKASRNWFFTINNPEAQIKPEEIQSILKMIWQLETGENGTDYYQGIVIFNKPMRLTKVRALISPLGHYQIIREKTAAERYVVKEETRKEGPWYYDIIPSKSHYELYKTGKLTPAMVTDRRDKQSVYDAVYDNPDMSLMQIMHNFGALVDGKIQFTKLLIAQRDNELASRKRIPIIFVSGKTGLGKTTFVHALCEENALTVFSWDGSKWWDGYERDPVVAIDEFIDSQYNIKDLNKLSNGKTLKFKIKGGHVSNSVKVLFLTSTQSIKNIYKQDRFRSDLIRRITTHFHFSSSRGSVVVNKYIPPYCESLKVSEDTFTFDLNDVYNGVIKLSKSIAFTITETQEYSASFERKNAL